MSKSPKKAPELRFKGFTDEWEQRKLRELMDFSNGINAPKESYGKGRKMISVLDILDQTPINYKNIRNSVEVNENIEDKNKVEKGDLVFVRSSEIVEEVGWSKAYLEDEYSLHSGFTIHGKRKKEFNANFVELSLNNSNRKQIERQAGGSTRFNVNQLILKDIMIREATIEEQTKIENFFKQLDSLITLHQRKLDALKRLKEAYLQDMFPMNGESVPKLRFANFEEDWEQRKLGSLVKITMGQSPSSENYTDNHNDFILVQGNADIKSGWVSPRVWTTQKTKIAEKGDLILTVRAPVGEIARTKYDVVLGRGVAGIKGNDFIYHLFNRLKVNNIWNKYSTGSTFDSINSIDLKELFVQFTLEKEQKLIGNILNNLDNFISLQQQKLEQLQNLKKAYLQKIFI